MSKKIYWVSRHQLTPDQMQALREIHEDDIEVIHEPVVFRELDGLTRYIQSHQDGFVYAVAGAAQMISAATQCTDQNSPGEPYVFGVFENDPERRADGSFGVAAVYHVQSWSFNNSNWEDSCQRRGGIWQVWKNSVEAVR